MPEVTVLTSIQALFPSERPALRPSIESAHSGEGEFGIVHKAMWCGTLVAAKILKTSSSIALGDFRSEIEVLRRVHHPNAVQARAQPFELLLII